MQLKLITLMDNAKIFQSVMIQDQTLISSQNTVTDINKVKWKEITEENKIGNNSLDEITAKQAE